MIDVSGGNLFRRFNLLLLLQTSSKDLPPYIRKYAVRIYIVRRKSVPKSFWPDLEASGANYVTKDESTGKT